MLAMQGQPKLLRERREGRDKGIAGRRGVGGEGWEEKRGGLGGKMKEVEERKWGQTDN